MARWARIQKVLKEKEAEPGSSLQTATDQAVLQQVPVPAPGLARQPAAEAEPAAAELPLEGKRFSSVDKTWRKALGDAKQNPHMISICAFFGSFLCFSWIACTSGAICCMPRMERIHQLRVLQDARADAIPDRAH